MPRFSANPSTPSNHASTSEGASQDLLSGIDSVVFDLDGTLWDTCEACAAGWNNVRARHGIRFRPITADDVRSVAGKPHDLCIREVFAGLPEDELRVLAYETQAEDNRLIAERGGVLYPGVLSGVRELRARYPLFIVSNCQAGYIELFLEFSGLSSSFCDYECFGRTGQTKEQNLRALIARNALTAPVFVGDTAGDQAAARDNGVPFVFASYGFGVGLASELRAGSFTELTSLLRRVAEKAPA
jgi:phosphoglycolate phosphatase